MADPIRTAAIQKALGAKTTPGVEPGVTGKEREFQQNRQFGPGAMKPYPNAKPPPARSSTSANDGVYRGGGKKSTLPLVERLPGRSRA